MRSLRSRAPSGSSRSSTVGTVHEGPGERNALLLAAGHLPDPALPVASEAHELERLADETGLLGLVDLPLAEAVAHVPGDVHVREQRVVLEDRVDVAAVGRHAGDRLAGEEDLALGRLLEPGDHPERRGFAAARRAEKAVKLTVLDAQVHPVDRDHLAEALGHVEELDVGDRRLGGPGPAGVEKPPGRHRSSVA